MFLLSIFQFLTTLEVSFSAGKFDYKPWIVFLILSLGTWFLLFVSSVIFKRVNFEIEILGIFFSGIGIISLCSVDIEQAYVQLAALGIGIIFFEFMIFFLKNPDIAMKFRPYVAFLAIAILVVNLIFGKVKNGSQNWIIIGPVSFQPSEFVKVAFIFFGTSTLRSVHGSTFCNGRFWYGLRVFCYIFVDIIYAFGKHKNCLSYMHCSSLGIFFDT